MGVLTSIEGSNPSFSASLSCPGGSAAGETGLRAALASEVRCLSVGGVAERSNAAVSKTVSGLWVRRGFKSLPLRFSEPRHPNVQAHWLRRRERTQTPSLH